MTASSGKPAALPFRPPSPAGSGRFGVCEAVFQHFTAGLRPRPAGLRPSPALAAGSEALGVCGSRCCISPQDCVQRQASSARTRPLRRRPGARRLRSGKPVFHRSDFQAVQRQASSAPFRPLSPAGSGRSDDVCEAVSHVTAGSAGPAVKPRPPTPDSVRGCDHRGRYVRSGRGVPARCECRSPTRASERKSGVRYAGEFNASRRNGAFYRLHPLQST